MHIANCNHGSDLGSCRHWRQITASQRASGIVRPCRGFKPHGSWWTVQLWTSIHGTCRLGTHCIDRTTPPMQTDDTVRQNDWLPRNHRGPRPDEPHRPRPTRSPPTICIACVAIAPHEVTMCTCCCGGAGGAYRVALLVRSTVSAGRLACRHGRQAGRRNGLLACQRRESTSTSLASLCLGMLVMVRRRQVAHCLFVASCCCCTRCGQHCGRHGVLRRTTPRSVAHGWSLACMLLSAPSSSCARRALEGATPLCLRSNLPRCRVRRVALLRREQLRCLHGTAVPCQTTTASASPH